MGIQLSKVAEDLQQREPRRRQIEALHGLLVRELHKRETSAATTQAAEPQKEKTESVGRAFLGLALGVAVPRLIGQAVWGSTYDAPHWWDVMCAILIIAGVLDVIAAVKARVNAS